MPRPPTRRARCSAPRSPSRALPGGPLRAGRRQLRRLHRRLAERRRGPAGRSPFADRLGDELASPALALADDGIDPGGLASAPFDGEGSPRGRTPLLADGRLLAYLHDSYTARRGGRSPPATRRAPPTARHPRSGPSNLMIEPGERSLEELIAEAADGVYITEVAGLHSGVNPVTGRFSVGASGRDDQRGELADPVREFTIAGDLLETLAAVRAVGSEPRWVPFGGSVHSAPLLVGEMTSRRL